MPWPSIEVRIKQKTVVGEIPPAYTRLDTPCHLWTGAKTQYGYGVITENFKRLCVHRVMLEKALGRHIQFNALHKCDVRNCVNPDHLKDGTQKENIRDAMSKGRMIVPKNGPRKLTREKADRIRVLSSQGWSQRKLAVEFGVSQRNIGFIVRNELWKVV